MEKHSIKSSSNTGIVVPIFCLEKKKNETKERKKDAAIIGDLESTAHDTISVQSYSRSPQESEPPRGEAGSPLSLLIGLSSCPVDLIFPPRT